MDVSQEQKYFGLFSEDIELWVGTKNKKLYEKLLIRFVVFKYIEELQLMIIYLLIFFLLDVNILFELHLI